MNSLGVYAGLLFGALGASVGLSELLLAVRRPKRWCSLDPNRRALILAVVSGAIAFAWGTKTIARSLKVKSQLSLLHDLEVRLVRFEGLVFSALAGGAHSRSSTLEGTLFDYLIKYESKLERSMVAVLEAEALSGGSAAELAQQFAQLSENFAEMDARGIRSKRAQVYVTNMLDALDHMRIIVEKGINNLSGEQ